MDTMYVICFYWEGHRWSPYMNVEGSLYHKDTLSKLGTVTKELASQYVNNLYKGVLRNATRDFKFICFTNDPLTVVDGVEIRPFPMVTGYGVLPRVWMFSQETGLAGHQVLCLDLDVVIVGKLEALMSYMGPFCARAKFMPGQEHKLDGDIMSFLAGPWIEEKIWKPFIADVDAAVDLTRGRERYWMRHTMGDIAERWQDHAPGAVLSYKKHVRHGKFPRNAEIVSCHGHPRPHQITEDRIRKHWDG